MSYDHTEFKTDNIELLRPVLAIKLSLDSDRLSHSRWYIWKDAKGESVAKVYLRISMMKNKLKRIEIANIESTKQGLGKKIFDLVCEEAQKAKFTFIVVGVYSDKIKKYCLEKEMTKINRFDYIKDFAE